MTLELEDESGGCARREAGGNVPSMNASPRVECTRGGARESVHPFSAVAVRGGEVVWSLGPEVETFWRSASKPFQLLNSLSCLPEVTVAGLSDEDLAVGAASHSGQPEHVARVTQLLSRFGLSVEGLQCGAHPPAHEPSAKHVETPTALHNNCSGKHTFMLAACAAQEWPLDYRPVSHPLQVRNQSTLASFGGTSLRVGVDGCSIPTFFAPLSAMARTWSRLAEAVKSGDGLLARIGLAMHRAPFFVSGSERLDLLVTERTSEPLAVKVGAEGLFCIGRLKEGEGVAVKVHSGNQDALAVAVKAVLAERGVQLSGEWPWAVVKNVRGVEVGERVIT